MLRNIDIDLLRCFVTIAELRSFTRAAAALFRSQSTVSSQIRRLEELAGQTLLQRSPHEVLLTRAGEQFLGYARRIVSLHDEALDSAGIDLIHAAGDVFVSLSHGEGWGLGAFEAATPPVRPLTGARR